MNPLTQVKNVQKITAREAAAGVSEDASWHAKYKESAYVFIGGLQYDLTEGDLLAVFAQYGEIVDVNLVRDKATGKSKGFAFLAYQDQRSTTLAVDNLNGATIVGRTVRVDHVANYKRKKEEDEEEEQRKREERGVCYAFQKGECHRGAACKFSHDEQRNANTGWGGKDGDPRWEHDQYEGASQRQHYKKPKYERRSRDDSRDDDDRSGLAGRSVQRSEDSQDRHTATIHEEASTKDVGRWLKYDERRENRNRLKDEKDSFTQPINAENHYMDGEPNRKRDRNQRCFDIGSRNAGKSEDRQDRHIATRHKEANTKDDDGRWSKYDERRGQNRLKDEKDGFTGPIDAEKHYVDAAPSRKRDNERGFDSGSKDAGKSGQKSGSEDRQDRHIATRREEANTKGDGRWSKYDERRGGQSRLKDEKDGFMKLKYAENRDMDTAPSRTRDRDKRGFDSGPTCANEKGGDDRSRDHSRRDYDRSEKDEDKRSRDHSTAEYDRNVRDNDRREAKYHRR